MYVLAPKKTIHFCACWTALGGPPDLLEVLTWYQDTTGSLHISLPEIGEYIISEFLLTKKYLSRVGAHPDVVSTQTHFSGIFEHIFDVRQKMKFLFGNFWPRSIAMQNLSLAPILAKSDCLCLEAFLRHSYEYSHLTKIGVVWGLSWGW